MNNNDVLRRLRYAFDYGDDKMMAIFEKAGASVTRAQLSNWLKREEDDSFSLMEDKMLATFLNGFIIEKRGEKDGPAPVAEEKLTNNIIFRKIKIALELQAEEILELLSYSDMFISKHELSALFRRPDHKHYRLCKDQMLRVFLKGIQLKYRDIPAQ